MFGIKGSIGQFINRILKNFNLKISRIDTLRLEDLRNRGFIPKQILDIGASDGKWTRECSEVFPNAHYFLIDPLEENRDALEKLRNQSSNKVNFIIAAAGSSAGSMKLNVEKGLDSSSFLKYAEPIVTTTLREVPVLTVDDLIRDNKINKPDLLKIDVEGFELAVLDGCSMIYGHTEIIILETSFLEFAEGMPLFHEVIGYMASKGYVFYDILTIMRRPYDGALAQIDAVFVKKDSKLRKSNLWFGSEHSYKEYLKGSLKRRKC